MCDHCGKGKKDNKPRSRAEIHFEVPNPTFRTTSPPTTKTIPVKVKLIKKR